MLEQTWDFQAETALLGLLLTDNSRLHHVAHLAADHFYEGLHGRIYTAIGATMAEGRRADPITLRPKFDRDPDLLDIGGAKYLAKLCGGGLCLTPPRDLADAIIEAAHRRRLTVACAQMLNRLETGAEAFAELAAALVAEVQDIDAGGGRRTRTNAEVCHEIIDDLKHRPPAVSTGLPRLDAAMGGGLYPGRSYGFAARKKVGKTAWAATLSHNLNQAGVPHLFIAAEMGVKEIHERVLCRALGKFPSKFRGNERDDPRLLSAIALHAKTAPSCTHYLDAPGITFDQLRQEVGAAVFRHRIRGFILDYWQLVQGKGKSQSTAEHLDQVAQWIANFCRQHGVWAITLAQLNQDGNTRGGEGVRLAFDQTYQIHGMGETEDVTGPGRWLETMDSRYTRFVEIGDCDTPGYRLNDLGPFFEELPALTERTPA